MTGRALSRCGILAKLTRSGMAVVCKAEDTKLERAVALQPLAAGLVSEEEFRKRLERGAEAAFHDPNVCAAQETAKAALRLRRRSPQTQAVHWELHRRPIR